MPGAAGLRAFLAVRSRFTEDCLADAIGCGIGQYVVLGAGLDTFAYRGAYDPARLEVTLGEGGVLQGSGGEFQVKVGHTPVLGWITVDVSDRVAAAGMLLRLSVRPREPGELPVIFAGPLGALIARNGTVVAAPAAREVAR